MKKLFLLLTTLCFLLAMTATALASNKMYHHQEYDFSMIRTLKVTEIDYERPDSEGSYYADSNAKQKVLSALYSASTKQNLAIIDESSKGIPEPTGESSIMNRGQKAPKAVELRLTINHMGYKKTITPGHYITKTEYIQQKSYDKRGREQTISIPVTHEEWVPDSVRYTSFLSIVYSVYDLETGTLIANLEDSRSRDYESNTSGMLSRSTKDFFNQLTKKK